jgi:hypothetical protein
VGALPLGWRAQGDAVIVDAAKPSTLVTGTLQSELGLIRDAIVMVASGYSSHVTVAGLTFGEQLMRLARELASEHGVRIVPQWSADEVGAGVAVVRP